MIIGVVGLIGSGKGTVGEILQKQFGFQPESFASHLKDIVAMMFDWPRDLLEGDTEESRLWREQLDMYWCEALGREDITPRMVLQQVGTESVRDVFGPDFWVACMKRRIVPHMNTTDYVITDCRFKNEVAAIKGWGGKIVRVRRGPEPIWYSAALATNLEEADDMEEYYPDVHVSEWDWIGSEFDHVIFNDGSLEDLEESVVDLLAKESS